MIDSQAGLKELVRNLLVSDADDVVGNFRHLTRLMSGQSEDLRMGAGWYAAMDCEWKHVLTRESPPQWTAYQDAFGLRLVQMRAAQRQQLRQTFADWVGVELRW